MKKTMQKPANWQDFEELCKKIWKEEWQCPEIVKNGRVGQTQHGVDISGIPSGKTAYYGIQCKGKDDYTESKLTKKEIDAEIEKAKTFDPKLEMLIFTTTANKDAEIEKYIRVKNIEHIKNKLFKISLYSWEDIVDLIEEHEHVYDWYLNGNLHKNHNEIEILINDKKTSEVEPLILKPKFTRKIVKYVFERPAYDPFPTANLFGHAAFSIDNTNVFKSIDGSHIKLKFQLNNVGRSVFSDIAFFVNLDENNSIKFIDGQGFLFSSNNWYIIDDYKVSIKGNQHISIVVGLAKSLETYIELPDKELSFELNWFFTSAQNSEPTKGKFYCKIEPEIIDLPNETQYIKDKKYERVEEIITPYKLDD